MERENNDQRPRRQQRQKPANARSFTVWRPTLYMGGTQFVLHLAFDTEEAMQEALTVLRE